MLSLWVYTHVDTIVINAKEENTSLVTTSTGKHRGQS